MHERGESIRTLADAVGLEPTSIYQLGKAMNEPRISLVARLAEHYGVTVDELLQPTTEFKEVFRNTLEVA